MTYDDIMAVEDSLQEAAVFYNGMRGPGHTCHSDSYMTCVDFEKLEKWYAKGLFSKEQLEYCIEYWTTNPNMQPPLKLVAFTVSRWMKEFQKKNLTTAYTSVNVVA